MGSCFSPDLPTQLLAPRVPSVTPCSEAGSLNHMAEECRSVVWLGCLDGYWGELTAHRRTAWSVGLLVEPLQLLSYTGCSIHCWYQHRKPPAFNTKRCRHAELPGRCPGPATHNHEFVCSFPSDTRVLSVCGREEAPRMGRMGKPLVKLETLKLLILWRNS